MRSRIRTAVATAVSLVVLSAVAAGPASAAVPDPNLYARCAYRSVAAESPDIHWLVNGWAVQYRFRVARYTTAGWQSYYTSGWRTSDSTDQNADPWAANFSPPSTWYTLSAPDATYMQVTVDEYFYFNGVYQGYRYRLPDHSGVIYSGSKAYCRTN
jgi:hypothetical protein